MQFSTRQPRELVADLEASSGLVSLVREASSAHEVFERDYGAPIEALADWVQALPACREHHCDPGGLLRYALQAGYYALRLADGVVFGAESGAEARRVIEIESRRAAFLAALGSSVVLAHQNLAVCSRDGEVWSEFSRPLALARWVSERGGSYSFNWRDDRTELPRALILWLAGKFVAPFLGGLRRDVAYATMAALCPHSAPQGAPPPLERIVRQALASSVEVAQRTQRARYARPTQVAVPSAAEVAAHVPEGPAAPIQDSYPEAKHEALRRARPPEPAERQTRPDGAAPGAQGAKPGPAQSELHLEGGVSEPLAPLPASMRELLDVLAEDIRTKENVRKRVRWDDSGWLVIDQNLLGGYGMGPAAGVAATLKKAKLAREGNGRTLHIVARIGELILPRSEAA